MPTSSFHRRSLLLPFCICFFFLFHYCYSHTQVLWITLVLEFQIFYGHTEWNLPSSLCDNSENLWNQIAVKLNSTKNSFGPCCAYELKNYPPWCRGWEGWPSWVAGGWVLVPEVSRVLQRPRAAHLKHSTPAVQQLFHRLRRTSLSVALHNDL